MPFVPYDDRPVSIDEGSREVRLPHETGISLTTRDHENEYKRVTMARLMTETNYLNYSTEYKQCKQIGVCCGHLATVGAMA